LAAAGAETALLEAGDFASGTSQQSSNLAWGGIKYLENREFRLVRGLCRSRNRLMQAFPLAVPEMPFLLSHEPDFRHGLTALQAGTLLYWVLGERKTRAPRRLSRKHLQEEAPIVDASRCDGALVYRDAWFADGDARFTFNLVQRANAHGAASANYLRCTGAERRGDRWHLTAENGTDRGKIELSARMMVNACGPWADPFAEIAGLQTGHRHVFSKGVHLIVPRLDSVRRVLAFFADDGRLFFTIPLGNRTCIGTTDTPVNSPDAVVTNADRQFILDNVNARLRLAQPLTCEDVIAERCGVRPLVTNDADASTEGRDWLQLSRKHAVAIDPCTAAVSIYGGKLTDCLNVGEEIVAAANELGIACNLPKNWFGIPDSKSAERTGKLLPKDPRLAERLLRRYQEHAPLVAKMLLDDPNLAQPVLEGADVCLGELQYAARHEFVVKPDDLFRRRTLLSLCYDANDVSLLEKQVWPDAIP
jgi:glycerol-3-phosphate dehydrogenase